MNDLQQKNAIFPIKISKIFVGKSKMENVKTLLGDQGDWAISEIHFKYKKLKFYDIPTQWICGISFSKSSKMGHIKAPEIQAIFRNFHHIFTNSDNIFKYVHLQLILVS